MEVSYGQRLADIARRSGDETAIIFVDEHGAERRLSWRQLDERSDRAAVVLDEHGVAADGTAIVRCGNGVGHFVATFAAWKLGACVIPLSATMPEAELAQVMNIVPGAFLIDDEQPPPDRSGLAVHRLLEASPGGRPPGAAGPRLNRVIPRPGKGIASGGSTGTPKIILDPRPWSREPGAFERERKVAGFGSHQVQLVAGPLYHQAPFMWSHRGLFEQHTLVVMQRFDAPRAIELIRRHRVQFACLVPTMMRRIVLAGATASDVWSLRAVFHTAAPCPPWLKHAWIDLIGPERLYEGYGSTEDFGGAAIRGDDWLGHPGSVGRANDCEIRILNRAGEELASGVTGEIFMRPRNTTEPTFRYLGSPDPRRTADGFLGSGDLGHLDDDGYLYVTDRAGDVVISGGANVYPAEVEGAILMHPDVADAVVIGLPDDEWGERVHAIVQSRSGQPFDQQLRAFVRGKIEPYKVPKTVEWTSRIPRTESGKIRRRELRAQRLQGLG